jgi:hypothetical protein
MLILILISGRYWGKSGSIIIQYTSYLYISRKPKNSVSGEVVYDILIEFEIPRKLVGLNKICLKETSIQII